MKPVELAERAICNPSRPGEVVLDAFGGSGTTLIAAEKAARAARLIELDPKYVDVIVRRWQDWTGELAYREPDGALLEGARADRLAISGEPLTMGVMRCVACTCCVPASPVPHGWSFPSVHRCRRVRRPPSQPPSALPGLPRWFRCNGRRSRLWMYLP